MKILDQFLILLSLILCLFGCSPSSSPSIIESNQPSYNVFRDTVDNGYDGKLSIFDNETEVKSVIIKNGYDWIIEDKYANETSFFSGSEERLYYEKWTPAYFMRDIFSTVRHQR